MHRFAGDPGSPGSSSRLRAGQRDLAGPVDLGMAGEDLLDQRRARSGQADDEDGPWRFEPRAGQSIEEIR